MATKVTLRQKTISGGRKSLYLDFYPPIINAENNKPTRREFLGLYVYANARNPIDKNQNKETLALGENIRAKRQLEIQSGQFGFLSKAKQKADFVAFFNQMTDKRRGSNSDNWVSALHHFKKFTGGYVAFSDLNEGFCNDYKDYLLTAKSKKSANLTLSQNSAVSYFNKFKATLKQAYKDGFLTTDLNRRVENIKYAETQRQFLTIEELNKLAQTECPIPLLKRAALFSALTGLRFSDIEKLTWGEVQQSEVDGYYLQYQQKKTQNVEVLPVSEQAYNLLGNKGTREEKVFKDLKYSAWLNGHLKQWVLRAGITKEITFHCFRHTYATLQLSLGTDLYTVSKMLGHREIKTTQVYAKIVDKTKRNAADKIKLTL